MNKKGFTLVELIAVIVIIAVIALITFQAINNRIKQAEENLYSTQVSNIVEASKKYMLEKENLDPYHVNTICVYISILQKEGFLEDGKIVDPKTKEDLSKKDTNGNSIGVVRVKYDHANNQYTYNFTDTCVSNVVTPIYETIIKKEEVNTVNKEDGLYETNDSYIYKGSNPNNYIKFNNSLWRIISIDKETKMVKIINLSDNQQSLKENGIVDYLNSDFESGTTYSQTKDFINTNSKWNVGTIDKLDSSTTINSLEKQSNDYKTIGLLTVSEYIESSLDKECYNSNTCDSYLSTNKNYWLLNKNGDKQWYISSDNKLENITPTDSLLYNVYPSLYLKINTQISSGTGTESDPYIIK